jgi:general secretion pathway protein E
MTGYLGRVGIYETMVMTPELKKVVTAQTDLSQLQETAYREGMKPLRLGGALKVAAGVTTVDEVMKVAPPPSGDRRQPAR